MFPDLRVLMITSEWPTPEQPHAVPFIVRQVESLQSTGIGVEVFSFRGNKRPSNYLKARAKASQRIQDGSFDLIHAQWGQSVLLALPKTKPVVVTFRGNDAFGIVGKRSRQTLQGLILKTVSRYSAFVADERIVVSKSVAAQLGLRDYHIIPSGIDLKKFISVDKQDARRKLGLPNKELVLFVGDAYNPGKCVPLMEKAIALSQVSRPAVEFVCVNNAPHEQIPLYMSACDVLLLASMHEGSPNVVKEALACNLPVVSTDVGDVRERIGAIEGCIVCENDAPETIATALTKVLSQGKRISGRQAVLDLDENLLTQKVIQVYHQAIEKTKTK